MPLCPVFSLKTVNRETHSFRTADALSLFLLFVWTKPGFLYNIINFVYIL